MTPETRPTILVVDDERGPRESLRMILEPQHRVLTCARGAEALEILRSHAVDLVTLDLNMPGMKGTELMRAARREFPEVEIVVITGCGSIESATEGIRHGICDYLQKPFDVVQVTAAVSRALARRGARHRMQVFVDQLAGIASHDHRARSILDGLRASRDLCAGSDGLLAAAASRSRHTQPTDGARTLPFLEVLAETIEAKDPYMRGHGRRVASYADLLAERIGLGGAARQRLRVAAFLHDLGKVGVPTDLLVRPGALAAAERAVVEQHPVLGARLVAPLDLPSEITLALRHHHEWWDGGGYPDGLAGGEIPVDARIVGVVDAFDAMTSDRPYRRALPRQVAAAEIRRFAGRQFDPHLANEFLAALDCDPWRLEAVSFAGAAPSAAHA